MGWWSSLKHVTMPPREEQRIFWSQDGLVPQVILECFTGMCSFILFLYFRPHWWEESASTSALSLLSKRIMSMKVSVLNGLRSKRFRVVLRCLTARKLGREQKSERGGGGERRRRFPFSLSPPLSPPFFCSRPISRASNTTKIVIF